MKRELADFILKPIGFEYKFEDDKVREKFLSAGFQTVTLFCPSCGGERVFTAIHYTDALNVAMIYSSTDHKVTSDNSIKRIKFACACTKSWVEILLETMPNSRLVKVGQYPDAVVFDRHINGDLMKVIAKDERAYRLSAARAYYAGLYIAAFNYLRRIFESLVMQAETQSGIGHSKQKMKDQIQGLVSAKALNPILLEPGFNVLYNLLSKGVHELSETECQTQYPFLQEAIDTILEDKLQEQLRQQRKERLSKNLGALNSGNPPK